jgi:hypothetical protein
LRRVLVEDLVTRIKADSAVAKAQALGSTC